MLTYQCPGELLGQLKIPKGAELSGYQNVYMALNPVMSGLGA